jgi:hypothetical protein
LNLFVPFALFAFLALVMPLAETDAAAADDFRHPPVPGAGTHGQAPIGGMPTNAPDPGMIFGEVIETMDSGGYTYLQIRAGTDTLWVAAPKLSVDVGDQVAMPAGSAMRDHYSKTLDRTFDVILFVAGVQVKGEQPDPDTFGNAHTRGGSDAAAKDLAVPKAEGGKTVADIYDSIDALAGSEVTVRGRVTKFSPRIMGKNWIHLADGTSAADGSSDLTVTTDTQVAVGNIVLVRGSVSKNRDFGYGYTYEVIIENASITAEGH